MTSPHITNQQKNSMRKYRRVGSPQLAHLLRTVSGFLPGLNISSAARIRLATIVENDELDIEALAGWSEQAHMHPHDVEKGTANLMDYLENRTMRRTIHRELVKNKTPDRATDRYPGIPFEPAAPYNNIASV